MNLQFYGNDTRATFGLTKIADSLDFDFSFEQNFSLSELREDALNSDVDFIVVDYNFYNEYPEEEFCSVMYDIASVKRTTIIFFMPGYSENSHVVTSLKSIGFDKFFLDETKNFTTIQTSLKEFIQSPGNFIENNKPDFSQEELITNRENYNKEIISQNQGLLNAEKEQSKTNEFELLNDANNVIKVAVCGILPRVGTTRVALQLCKTANYFNEGSAAYIEVKGKYLTNLCNYYEITRLKPVGIMFENVSMYKISDIPKITKKGYSVMVYDFGVINEDNVISILDKDIVVIVGASGPSEIAAFTPAIKLTMESSVVNYVFYDVPKAQEERASIIELMGCVKDRTLFVEHISDPFNLNMENLKIYKKILSTKGDINVQDIKKRKTLSRAFG